MKEDLVNFLNWLKKQEYRNAILERNTTETINYYLKSIYSEEIVETLKCNICNGLGVLIKKESEEQWEWTMCPSCRNNC